MPFTGRSKRVMGRPRIVAPLLARVVDSLLATVPDLIHLISVFCDNIKLHFFHVKIISLFLQRLTIIFLIFFIAQFNYISLFKVIDFACKYSFFSSLLSGIYHILYYILYVCPAKI